MSLSEKELKSIVSDAVKAAMKPPETETYTCPGCKFTTNDLTAYMDHRFMDTYLPNMKEELKQKPEDVVVSCKDGICKLIDERLEALKLGQKPEETKPEEPGLFGNVDEPE